MIRQNRRRPSVKPKKWPVPRSVTYPLGLLIGIGLLMVWMLEATGVRHYVKMTQALDKTHEEVVELEQANTTLRHEIQLVESDPFTLEKLTRERLGYVKEGEVVYQFVESP